MNDLILFYPKGHKAHSELGHPERPERVEEIRSKLEKAGVWEKYPLAEPQHVSQDILHAIHLPSYLEKLESTIRRGGRMDMDTYLTTNSWELAMNAVGGGVAVAKAVWNRAAKRGFALTRPPGHHATPNRAMGFCLLNNIALAAEYLLQAEGAQRLAIIDIDVHHGNGTQDIFWQRNDIFYISTHQSPLYPGTGRVTDIGKGDGEGYTANIPLPPFSGDKAMRTSLNSIILPLLEKFSPEMILISVGYDAHWRDPLAQLLFSSNTYGSTISTFTDWADKNCNGRIAIFLEGGYDLEAGATSALAVVQALLGNDWQDPLGDSPKEEENFWYPVIDTAQKIWSL
jgi:acetoin utilization deacetylase AcuC-like enzyme